METWASHYSVRNFWGVTEEQDYDVKCGQQPEEALEVPTPNEGPTYKSTIFAKLK
jgi:hypothetical protein